MEALIILGASAVIGLAVRSSTEDFHIASAAFIFCLCLFYLLAKIKRH